MITRDIHGLDEDAKFDRRIADDFYNQLYGKEMTAYFENQEMRRLEVSGNVQAILLPMENDSTYNKHVTAKVFFSIFYISLRDLGTWPVDNA